jgi:restriction system protein
MWGVHMGAHVEDRPVEGGYVAIGWPALGDVRAIGTSRDDYKRAMTSAYVDIKPGAVPVDAGTVFKYVHEIRAGDYVIYPSKSDRMINIGRFTGQSAYDPNDADDIQTGNWSNGWGIFLETSSAKVPWTKSDHSRPSFG